jgi:DNA repair protein RecN (Recombination protein N)
VQAIERALEGLGGDAAARSRELEFLRFQLGEIERAHLTDPGEDERLAVEEGLLGDADAHRAAGAAAIGALGTDGGARDLLSTALAELRDRPPFAAIAARLHAVVSELEDVLHDLRTGTDSIDADPARLASLQARRAELSDLRRRYAGSGRASLAEVFAVRDELTARATELESQGERAATADHDRQVAHAAVAEAARVVGAARRSHAPALAAAVQARLADLALAKAVVAIEVGADDPGDDVSFQLALNPGLPLAPLAKAASGGELARVMLALRLVVGAQVPTLVFDEVDAGVGGAAARSVGRSLAALAADRQVLVVTHLPQVAAFADAQIALTKELDGATTVVRADALDQDARVRELARMLSGMEESESGQDHAEELLAMAATERGR